MRCHGFVRAGRMAAWMLVVLLTACGGGGGDGAPAEPPVPAVAIPDDLTVTAAAVTDVASATAFTNSAAGKTGLNFSWNFGDGGTSTEASPKHDYAKVGDYQGSLTVSNTAGASKEIKFKVSVNNRAVVAGLSCSAADQSGWCWQAPRPSGNSVNDLHFLSAQLGWTVGDNGEIQKTTDGGKTWTRQFSGITAPLLSVRFADPQNGWILGAYGAVLHTTDGGAHWQLQEAAALDYTGATLGVINASTALVRDGSGHMRSTTDGGVNWKQSVAPSNYSTAALNTDGTLWLVTNDALLTSKDLGQSWTPVLDKLRAGSYRLAMRGQALWLLGQIWSINASNGNWVYELTLRRSLDAGASWTTLAVDGLPSGPVSIDTLDFVDADVGSVAVALDLYRTTDGGRHWTLVPPPDDLQFSVFGNQVPAPGTRYRGYYDRSGQYVHQLSSDAGATWTRIKSPSPYGGGLDWQRIQRVDANNWVNFSATSLKWSADGMSSWSLLRGTDDATSSRVLSALWFFDAKRGLSLTQQGELLETQNGGLDWTSRLSGLPGVGFSRTRIQFAGADKGWLLAGDGKVYRTVDGGARWSTSLDGLSTAITRFHFVDANNGFALAYDRNTYKTYLVSTTDGAQSWVRSSELSEGYSDLIFTTPLQGVVVGYNGHIVSTSDGGKTWQNRYSGTGNNLASLAYSEATGLWAVGVGGALLNSTDGGATWTDRGGATTLGLNKIRFVDAQNGWAVGELGTLLVTTDGGKTWSKQFAGTQGALIDVFFADSRTGWILGSSGEVLATGTGGR